jgi:anti-sigma factor RsiW
MTRHVSEDTVLKLALGLLDPRAEGRVRHHLEGCTKCSGLLEEVDRTMRLLKDVTPEIKADLPVLPSLRQSRYKWLRVAAMLAVGFGLGFLASESLHSPAMTVIRQQLVPRPPEHPGAGFVVCDEIDLSGRLR